ncbi:MAG: hypothetical protein V3S64_14200 [bacterium]
MNERVRTTSPFYRSKIEGAYPINTGITETPAYLYIGSLVAPVLDRLPKAKAGL